MYSTVGAVADAIGLAAVPGAGADLDALNSVRASASAVVDNETGHRYTETEADEIPAAIALATELLAVDFWRARTATRGGGLAGADTDFPSPSIMIDVRRILAPYRRVRIFGGALVGGTGSSGGSPGVEGGTVVIADGSITLEQLSTTVQRLIENPAIPNDSITLLQLTPDLRQQIQAGGIPADSITTVELAPAIVTLLEQPVPAAGSITLAQLEQTVRTQITSPTLANNSIPLVALNSAVRQLINNPTPAAGTITLAQLDTGLQNTISEPTPAAGTITLAMLQESVRNMVESPTPPVNSVDTDQIQDLAVTTIKLGNLQVTTAKIGNDQVTNDKLANDSVRNAQIQNNAVNNPKIQNNSITNAKINSNAVTTSKIKNLNVTGGKIADNTITASKLRNNSVTTDKIGDAQVTTNKIGPSQVTLEKMANNSVGHHQIIEGGLTTDNYGNLTITEGKLASGVTTKLNAPAAVTAGSVTRSSFDAATQLLLTPGGAGVQPAARRVFLGYSDMRIDDPITYGGLAGFRRTTGPSGGSVTSHSTLLTGDNTYVIRWNTSGTHFTQLSNYVPSSTSVATNGAINLANGTWYVDVNVSIIPNPSLPTGNNDKMLAAAIIYYGAAELHSGSHYFPNFNFNVAEYNNTQARINVSGLVHDDGTSRMSVGFRVVLESGSDLTGYYVPRANFHAIRIL